MPSSDRHADSPEQTDSRNFEHASEEDKSRAVSDLIHKTSLKAAATTLQPIPLADAAILTPIQHSMVRSIGHIRGRPLDDATVRAMFRAVRTPILKAQTTIAAVKLVQLIPVVPEALEMSVAYALTYAIGVACDQYLLGQMSAEQAKGRVEAISKERFKQEFRLKRDEVRGRLSNRETRRQVADLKKARRHGEIDENEEARRLSAILGEHGH